MWNINLETLKANQTRFNSVAEKKIELDSLRPIPTMALERIKSEISLEWTYNSNAIEGNTLSLNETKLVLEEGITIGGKSLKEHFEVINHQKAIGYLMDLAKETTEIRAIDLLNIHALVMKNIDENFAGRLRNGMVRIGGASFTPPAPPFLSDMIDELIVFVNQNPLGLDPISLSAVFHHRMVYIHPFFDGNGRTTRLCMNLLLIRAGYPPAIILKNDRKKYYSALGMADRGNFASLQLLMLQAVERSFNLYLNLMPTSYKIFEPISQIVSESDMPYGMEYVSLLARTGQINAHKEGRNWVTTKEEVLKYYKQKRGK
jgi:Fic family protein